MYCERNTDSAASQVGKGLGELIEHVFVFIGRDGHQNLKLLIIDLNQMHLIMLVRTILVFK